MSHLEAVQGVVGHAHFSPVKVGDSGGPLPSAALGASELQPPPRAGRARAVGGGRLGLGVGVLAPGAGGGGGLRGAEKTWFLQRRKRPGKWEWVWSLQPGCVYVRACVSVPVCVEMCASPRMLPAPRPSSFLHTPTSVSIFCVQSSVQSSRCPHLLLSLRHLLPPLPACGPGSPALSICLA